LYLQSDVENLFGLTFQTALLEINENPVLLAPGGNVSLANGSPSAFYSQTVPTLNNSGYYFAPVLSQGADIMGFSPSASEQPYPLPVNLGFSMTNQTPLLLASVGQSILVGGWTKEQIANGDSTKFGYLGQYFERAYRFDTSGAPIADSADILSPYGDFFPTEPGMVALVTMTNWGENIRGTGVVHVISLNIDANHDGTMDLSYYSTDQTTVHHPFRFWVNNDHDEPASGSNPDRDLNAWGVPPQHPLDYTDGAIHCQRNLEDFARLWACGLPKLPPSQGYTIAFSMSASSGNPAINLYAAITNSADYLSSTLAASNQFTKQYLGGQLMMDYSKKLGTISTSQSYNLPLSSDGAPQYTNFLFEGAGIGVGQLTLTITRYATNVIAQTGAWIDLRDIQDMVEHVHITNPLPSPPYSTLTDQSAYTEDNFVPVDGADGKGLIVFVHGWRLTPWVAENFAQTFFKRLYWQGYQGRFVTLQWPTLSSETDGPILQYLTFNRDEYIAFKCAQGAANYFQRLRSRFPDYSINVCAHSHGNIVMMEVLRRYLANGQKPLDNYVMMQAAVAAECYDTNAPLCPGFVLDRGNLPDSFYGYPGPIQNALAGRISNFYNTNDFGVVTCWEPDQTLYKPDGRYFYQYLPQGPFQSPIGSSRAITDPHEMMAFVSRPTTQAVGAMGGLNGAITGDQVDLSALVGFSGNWQEHSGEFNWPIQRLSPFYRAVLNAFR
jgi:hypothetical protein